MKTIESIRPTTIFLWIYLIFCLVAVVFSWVAVITINGQNERLKAVIINQENDILNLKIKLAVAKDRSNVGLVLDYIMPEICVSELSKTAYGIRRMKEVK